MSEIWFLNRGLVLLRPRAPFVSWVRTVDPSDAPPPDETVRAFTSACLVPQAESEEEAWDWIRANHRFLFEFVLNEWYTDESLWPKDRSWTGFREWLDVELVEVVWDLVDEPLTSDPDAPEHQVY